MTPRSNLPLAFALATLAACSDAPQSIGSQLTDDSGVVDPDAGAVTCEPGLDLCGGVCVDLQSPDQCGSCGNVCPAGANGAARSCTAGKCTTGCKTGTRLCASKNSCEKESASSCGASCAVCPAPASNGYALCDTGTCAIVCSAGYATCSSGCCATHVVDIALGEGHACALDVLGNVKCWGDDLNGQTGDGPTFHASNTAHITAAPFQVAVPAAAQIAASSDRSCVILKTGEMMCWGYSGDGALGDPNAFNTNIPVYAKGVTAASAMGLGDQHTCAVQGGTVKCWGTNDYGQIGNNGSKVTKVTTPANVVGITTAIAVTGGLHHTCALLSGGTVKCWGRAAVLGNPAVTVDSPVPVDVPGLSGITAISAGRSHTCALTSAGAIKCWGFGTSGELGNGLNATSVAPVDVTLNGTATRISAGAYETCAILSTGGMQCWGENGYGQIGDGTILYRSVPTSNGLTATGRIATGLYVACAVAADATTRCWGSKGAITRALASVLTPAVVTGLP